MGVTGFASNGSGYCDAGFYCQTGISTSRPSPPLATGRGGVCPQGSYCPVGTDIPELCPRGRYSSLTGLKNWTDCQLCEFGKYCGAKGLNVTSGTHFIF